MSVTFVVKSPIHGYGGMGYENVGILERAFSTEAAARKHLRRCNKAWQIYQEVTGYPGRCMTDREEEFSREMCENVSYCFRGESTLVKREILDTII